MNEVDDRITRYAAVWQRETELPSVPEFRQPLRRPWPGALVTVAASIAMLSAGGLVVVSSLRDGPRPQPGASPAGVPEALPRGLDRYTAGDAQFFAQLAGRAGGSEVEHYASLRDAFENAGVVVVAEVIEVRSTRSVVDGSPDAVSYVGVVLRPVEILHGALRDPGADLVVEFAGGADSVRSALPGGYAVWFLRNKGDLAPGVTPKPGARSAADEAAYYRLVSSQGLFVQGATHVVNPVREKATPEAGSPSVDPESTGPRDPVARDAEAFPTLSALVSYLRLLG